MRILLDSLLFFLNHAFSPSASVRMISTVKIYFLLYFSLPGRVYSQNPEIEISKPPTSRLGHPKEKQELKGVSLMSTMKASLSKFLNCRDSIIVGSAL